MKKKYELPSVMVVYVTSDMLTLSNGEGTTRDFDGWHDNPFGAGDVGGDIV